MARPYEEDEPAQLALARSASSLLIVGSLFVLGLAVRLHDYVLAPGLTDVPTEFSFGWAGLRLLAGRAPSGASSLAPYAGHAVDVTYVGLRFHLATPWVDAPPLWALLSGLSARVAGATQFQQLTVEAMRRPSLLFGVITVPLGYALARRVMPPIAALAAGALLAVEPGLVLLSRVSVPEAALAAAILFVVLLVSPPVPETQPQGSAGVGPAPELAPSRAALASLAAVCALAPLARLSGIAVAVAGAGILYSRGLRREAVIAAAAGGAGLVAALLYGFAAGGGLFLPVLKAQADSGGGAAGLLTLITGRPGPGRTLLDGWAVFGWIALAYLAGNAKRRHRNRALLWPVVAYVAIAVPFLSARDLPFEGWFLLPVLPLLLIGATAALYAAVREGQLLLPALAALTAVAWSIQWIVVGGWQPGAVVLLALAGVALVPLAVAEVQPRGAVRDAGQGIWAALAFTALAGCVVLSWNLAIELPRLG